MEKGNSTDKCINATAVLGKIEKVPMGIQDEKSRKDPASSGKPVSTIGALVSKSPKEGTEPCVRKGKRSLLACLSHCNVPLKPLIIR